MHLYGELFDTNCFPCARRLAEDGVVGERWERRGWLGRLVRVAEAPVHAELVDRAA